MMIHRGISSQVSFEGRSKAISGRQSKPRKNYWMTTIPEKSSVSTRSGFSTKVPKLESFSKASAWGSPSLNAETYRPCQENLKQRYKSKNDVHFHCSDGIIIHARKCVLSSTSLYFANTFNHTWEKEHPDGIWKVSEPSDIMKIVLTAMYTGSIEKEDIRRQPIAILSLAKKYQIAPIVHAVEIILTRSIEINNVKELLRCSDEHGLKSLKEECFDFIKKNAYTIFAEKEFMELESEDAPLWSEMKTYVLESY